MTGGRGKGFAGAQMVVNRAPEPMKVNGRDNEVIRLINPVSGDEMRDYARVNLDAELARGGPEMVQHNMFHGQVLALCGAGPSLNGHMYPADQVWGCNSAVNALVDRGLTAGIGIDQTVVMMQDWADPPDVPYFVASTCYPKVIEHLRERGRRLIWFHNLVGWGDGEIDHYNNDWPPAYMIGTSGATIVSRVLGLAAWMGFRRIDVYGADCSFAEGNIAHANGETVTEAYGRSVMMEGEIGGRTWRARPDMLMCAVDLARRVRDSEGRIRLMGDTLPVALLGYDDDVLDEVSQRVAPGFRPNIPNEGAA